MQKKLMLGRLDIESSPGYEAFLIAEGYEPFEARLMGHAVNNLGKRLAREREAERALAGVLRAVIKGEEKGPLVAARRAKALRLELASPDSCDPSPPCRAGPG